MTDQANNDNGAAKTTKLGIKGKLGGGLNLANPLIKDVGSRSGGKTKVVVVSKSLNPTGSRLNAGQRSNQATLTTTEHQQRLSVLRKAENEKPKQALSFKPQSTQQTFDDESKNPNHESGQENSIKSASQSTQELETPNNTVSSAPATPSQEYKKRQMRPRSHQGGNTGQRQDKQRGYRRGKDEKQDGAVNNQTTVRYASSARLVTDTKSTIRDLNHLSRRPNQDVDIDKIKKDQEKQAGAPNAVTSTVRPSIDDRSKYKKKDRTSTSDDAEGVTANASKKVQVGGIFRRHNQKKIVEKLDSITSVAHNPEDSYEDIEVDERFTRPKIARRKKNKFAAKVQKEKLIREVSVPELITVAELANRMSEKTSEVIKTLVNMGLMFTVNDTIDADTAEMVAIELGHTVKRVSDQYIESKILSQSMDEVFEKEMRSPVVTIMGHVDHGKTSLLDALRQTDVAASEAGGITQHIGAYKVTIKDGRSITFLDTPGHEAFTAMRSRGAKITDIVVLVISADDGIMMQTIEAINHAKAAGVCIIVAVNKIDKPGADVNRVKMELLRHDLIPEEMGGDIIIVPVSAKEKLNLDKLEEAILAQSEMMHLEANVKGPAFGTVIESSLEKNKGPVATLLVQSGTLRVGDILVSGSFYCKVRALVDYRGKAMQFAGPSDPVEVLGFENAPNAGDQFLVIKSDKHARELIELRANTEKQKKHIATTGYKVLSMENIFNISTVDGGKKELTVVVKGDVQGSVDAIKGSLLKLETEEISIKLLHAASGPIVESDINLASTCSAVIIGFNVRADAKASDLAKKLGINIQYYSIIYNLIDDIKAIMIGMLDPIRTEEVLGGAEVKQVFDVTKVGKVAGCIVTNGLIRRNANVRIIRGGVVIHDGKLKMLKRFKDDAKEVRSGFECGVGFERYEDIKEGDVLECYQVKDEARQS